MTLLSVVRDVCATVGVAIPQSVFSNITGNRTMAEMLSKANEAAQSIAYDHRDWTRLRTTVTYAGDGVLVPPDPPGQVMTGTTAFDLPADYKRMLLTGNVWRSGSMQFPMQFIPDTDEWLHRRLQSVSSAYGEWALLGGQIHIYPVMPADVSAYFAYMNKNCVALNSGGFGDVFQSDLDNFVLDERLLKLGMIWNWKKDKGTAYAEDMGTYQDALNSVAGRDSPAPIIVGRVVYNKSATGYLPSWPS